MDAAGIKDGINARRGSIGAAVKTIQRDKLTRLVECLESLKEDRFTGYLRINYTQGSIGRIEKFEEILK